MDRVQRKRHPDIGRLVLLGDGRRGGVQVAAEATEIRQDAGIVERLHTLRGLVRVRGIIENVDLEGQLAAERFDHGAAAGIDVFDGQLIAVLDLLATRRIATRQADGGADLDARHRVSSGGGGCLRRGCGGRLRRGRLRGSRRRRRRGRRLAGRQE